MGLEILTFHRRIPDVVSGTTSSPDFQWDNRKNLFRLSLFIFVFFVYLSIGATIFRTIEAPEENKFAAELKDFLKEFRRRYPSIDNQDLAQLIAKVSQATDKGLRFSKNSSIIAGNWGFGQSFFFSGTLVTTVGYGHVSPVSQLGKAFTIFYCIVGIPAFLILLNALVDRLKRPSSLLFEYFNARLAGIYRPSCIQWLHLFTIFALLLVFAFIIPSLLFMLGEHDWTFLDAFYYCFISLTTIGLGDYIPGDKVEQPNRGIYKILTTGYLIMGIICMMVFLAVLYDMPYLNLSRLFTPKDNFDDERSRLARKDSPSSNYTRQIDEGVTTPATPSRQSTGTNAAEAPK